MFKNLFSLVAAPLLLVSSVAFAESYTFNQISNNAGINIGGQLEVNITQDGSNVLFEFNNNVGVASNVAEIYFDNETTSFLSNYSISSQSGATFQDGSVNPSDANGVPGFSADYAADSDLKGGGSDGLNAVGDYVIISAALTGTFADFINAVNNGNYNIALHVRSINGGTSDWYALNGNPSQVPVPAAAWLFASGLGFLGASRKRNRA